MRVLSIILAICFIYYIDCEIQMTGCSSTQDYDKETLKNVEVSHKSADDCKNRLTDENKKDGDKCCYEYGSKKEDKGYCVLLNKYEYENIGKYLKIYDLQAEIYKDMPKSSSSESEDYGTMHIDCHSNYIKIGLISLLLILF